MAAQSTEGDETVFISAYGLLDGGYAVTTTHRVLSDITPLLDRDLATRLIIGGDFNCSTRPALLGADQPRWGRPRVRPRSSLADQWRRRAGLASLSGQPADREAPRAVGVGRWTNRVIAYAHVLVTDRYPPFRLDP